MHSATAVPNELAEFLRSSDAHDILDDAVLGCLLSSTVSEVCETFAVPPRVFAVALDAAISEGF